MLVFDLAGKIATLMNQCPVTSSLQVCEKVVIEADTRNLTLVNCFTHRVVKSVPPEPLSFIVCSVLPEGHDNAWKCHSVLRHSC